MRAGHEHRRHTGTSASNPELLALPAASFGDAQEGGIEQDDDGADLSDAPRNRLDTSDTTSHGSLDTTLSDLRYDAPWIRPGSHLQGTAEADPEVIIREALTRAEWDAFSQYHATGGNI